MSDARRYPPKRGITRSTAIGALLAVGAAGIAPSSCASSVYRCDPGPTTDAKIEWSLVVPFGTGYLAPHILALSNGNYVVTGNPGPGASIAGVPLGQGDIFVAELSSDGHVLWAQTFGSPSGFDLVAALAADEANDVYLAISTGAHDLTLGATTLTNDQSPDWMTVVTRLDGASGEPTWARAYHAVGSSLQVGSMAARDGALVLGGSFGGTLDPGGIDLPAPQNEQAGFVAKFSAVDGAVEWADAYVPAGGFARSLGILSNGDVVFVITASGSFDGIALPTPAPATAAKFGLLVVLSGADGTAVRDLPFADAVVDIETFELAADANDHVSVLGAYQTAPEQLGGFPAPPGPHYFVYSTDASLDARSLAAMASPQAEGAPFLSGITAGPNDEIAILGSTTHLEMPEIGGKSLGSTPLAEDGDGIALFAAVLDPATGDVVYAFDIPTVGQADPLGSWGGSDIAFGQDGRIAIAAGLEGVVNLDECGVDARGAVFFSTAR